MDTIDSPELMVVLDLLLHLLDGGPGGSEASRDLEEATEPSVLVCTFCTW